MTATYISALVALSVSAILLSFGLTKLWVYIRDGRCYECKRFGLERDTRRYRAEDEFLLNTIIYCPKCGSVNDCWQYEDNGEK